MNNLRSQTFASRRAKSRNDILGLVAKGTLTKHKLKKKQPRIKPRYGILANALTWKVLREREGEAPNQKPSQVIITNRVKARLDGDLALLVENNNGANEPKRAKPPESYIDMQQSPKKRKMPTATKPPNKRENAKVNVPKQNKNVTPNQKDNTPVSANVSDFTLDRGEPSKIVSPAKTNEFFARTTFSIPSSIPVIELNSSTDFDTVQDRIRATYADSPPNWSDHVSHFPSKITFETSSSTPSTMHSYESQSSGSSNLKSNSWKETSFSPDMNQLGENSNDFLHGRKKLKKLHLPMLTMEMVVAQKERAAKRANDLLFPDERKPSFEISPEPARVKVTKTLVSSHNGSPIYEKYAWRTIK